jgi:general secretion pathway protein I
MSQRKIKIRESGFSLLEILIAFAILSISVSIILKIFATGLTSTHLANDYTNAVQIANNLIAQTSMENPLQRSESSGIENNMYHWRRQIVPHQFLSAELDISTLPIQIYQINIEVWWGDGRHHTLELSTLKMITKEINTPY